MSKKWVRLIIFMFCIALITGCNISTPIKQLLLAVHVAADSVDEYYAYGYLYDHEKNESLNDDVELDITVEGSTITKHDKAHEEHVPGVSSPVTIIASHPRIGTIQKDIKIPESIPDLYVDPETPFADWVNKEIDNLTLRWTTIESIPGEKNADFYVVHVRATNGIDEASNLATGNRQWTGAITEDPDTNIKTTSITIDKANRDDLLKFPTVSNPTSYSIQVQGYNMVTLTEISDDSAFQVGGKWSNSISSN